MPEHAPDDEALPTEEPPPRGDRYVAIDLLDGASVIYDRENHAAWIQSDDAVELTTLA